MRKLSLILILFCISCGPSQRFDASEYSRWGNTIGLLKVHYHKKMHQSHVPFAADTVRQKWSQYQLSHPSLVYRARLHPISQITVYVQRPSVKGVAGFRVSHQSYSYDLDNRRIVVVAGERIELPKLYHAIHHLMIDHPTGDTWHETGSWGQVNTQEDMLNSIIRNMRVRTP